MIAREAGAHLRAAAVRYPDDPRLAELLAELRAESPEFRVWWDEHAVSVWRSRQKRLAHPTHGEITFYNESMELIGDGLLFMVYVPADPASARACEVLSTRPGTRRALRAVGES